MRASSKILVLTLSLFAAGALNAQDSNFDTWRISPGIKAGVNISNVYDERGEDFVADGKAGIMIGTFLAIPIGEFLGFQPELHFSQRGFNGTGRVNGMYYDLRRTSNFIDVPLLFALRPTPRVSLIAGPQFSYLISQRDKFSDGTSSIAITQEFDNENLRRNLACFVTGLDLNVEPMIFSFRAGMDFQSNQGDGTSATPRYKNAWVQLSLGARF
jgi:hypothetical protein